MLKTVLFASRFMRKSFLFGPSLFNPPCSLLYAWVSTIRPGCVINRALCSQRRPLGSSPRWHLGSHQYKRHLTSILFPGNRIKGKTALVVCCCAGVCVCRCLCPFILLTMWLTCFTCANSLILKTKC